MQIHHSLETFKAKNPVLTIGMFDGVHKGHKTILAQLEKEKKQLQGESVVLTFWPHPQVFFGRTDGFDMISTLEEKCYHLEQTGLDHCIILPFTKEFASLSPEDYILKILHQGIGVKKVFIGYDHKYGNKGAGDFALLKKTGAQLGFNVEEIKAYDVEDVHVSSTQVRKAILSGNMEQAKAYLGYNYSISGTVVKGKQIGRTIGIPTANLLPDSAYKILPPKGVYVGAVLCSGRVYKAAVSIGLNPTVNTENKILSIEAYILDFNEDIYGQEIKLYFLSRIRDEEKYNSLEELKQAINNDVAIVRSYKE